MLPPAQSSPHATFNKELPLHAHAYRERDLRPWQAETVTVPKDIRYRHHAGSLHRALSPLFDRRIDEAEPGEDRRAQERGCRCSLTADWPVPETRPRTGKCVRISHFDTLNIRLIK